MNAHLKGAGTKSDEGQACFDVLDLKSCLFDFAEPSLGGGAFVNNINNRKMHYYIEYCTVFYLSC